MRPCSAVAAAPLVAAAHAPRPLRPAAVEHVSGDDGSGDIFHVRPPSVILLVQLPFRARTLTPPIPPPCHLIPLPHPIPPPCHLPQGGDDVGEQPTAAEARGPHETLAHHKHRLHMVGRPVEAETL